MKTGTCLPSAGRARFEPSMTKSKESRWGFVSAANMAAGRRTRDICAFFAAAFCFAFSFQVQAQHARASGAPCQPAASINLTTQCFVAAARKADKELNWIYRGLRKELKSDEFEKLEAAQSRWHPFREANCIAERDLYTEQSAASLAYAACAEAETRHRVEELKTMYSWLFP